MERKTELWRLAPGERGRVAELTVTGPMRRRFLDIGLVVGAEVICVGRSPCGDPTAYRICGAVIAIRRQDAAGVWIVRTENDEA